MSIKRKLIEIEIEDKKYGMILDFEAAIEFQELSGKSIFKGLDEIGQTQDIVTLGYFLASCLKGDDGKSVGLEFVKGLDIFASMETFMKAFEDLISNSLEKSTGKTVKKNKMKI